MAHESRSVAVGAICMILSQSDLRTIPCERCGAADTSYADRCGDTRHARMVDQLQRLRWRLLDSWRPKPCPACGERKCAADCDGIPF